MRETMVREYGGGPHRDEGGEFDQRIVKEPSWVHRAQAHCVGCHDNFYNHRLNFNGNTWCRSLRQEYATRETRPDCYH